MRIKLSNLTYNLFEQSDAWRVVEETINEEDVFLEPALKNSLGLIEKDNSEVWCLCKAVFNDGDAYKASALCRGDSNQSPLLWTFWNGNEDVILTMPPAPAFVLEKDGPIAFSKKFGKSMNKIFPITFQVIPKFQVGPHERSLIIELL